MSIGTLLEIASNVVQVGVGVASICFAVMLRRLPVYAILMGVVGVSLVFTGSAGLFNIGALAEVARYRRPLFIIERVSTMLVFFYVVIRNKLLVSALRGVPVGDSEDGGH